MRLENICTFILDLQLFEYNFQQQEPSALTDRIGAYCRRAEYRLHTG